jgi:tRNA G18 (ribose-2'-O)-methylase SpoU
MSKAPSLRARLVEAAGPQPVPAVVAIEADNAPASPTLAKARQGKTMVAGYFSPDFARSVKMLAVERGVTVQSLLGEALDDLLRRHGKHPFGER